MRCLHGRTGGHTPRRIFDKGLPYNAGLVIHSPALLTNRCHFLWKIYKTQFYVAHPPPKGDAPPGCLYSRGKAESTIGRVGGPLPEAVLRLVQDIFTGRVTSTGAIEKSGGS